VVKRLSMMRTLRLAEGYVEVKALGRRGVVYTLGWNYHAFGRTALLLNRVDEARHDGIAAHRFDQIGEGQLPQGAGACRAAVCARSSHCRLGLGELYRRAGKRQPKSTWPSPT
jgi:hypothetical protein